MEKAEWNVRAGNSDHQIPATPGPVPLKWAGDAATGAPRSIHVPDIVSQAASAVCPGCGSKLWKVLAGEPLRVQPTAHFRHVAGSPRTACVVVSARLAASHLLASLGYIDLPRRRVSAVLKGFSGKGCEGWVEEQAQRVRVSDVRMVELAAAELTLDDGRTILVDLTGERVEGQAGRAVMTINLSDPALAEVDVDELRARLRLLPPMRWCSDWRDRKMSSQARTRAADEARLELDAWTEEDGARFQAQLPPGADPEATATMHRETLLHRSVKSTLEDARCIRAPGLHVAVQRDAPDGYGDGWEHHRVEILWWSAPAELWFEAVELARRLGRIFPDVVGRLAEPRPRPRIFGGMATRVQRGDVEDEEERHDEFPAHWSEAVLIEVAVTHRVDEEKLRKIRQLDLPTLETDLGSMGGRLTLDGLRKQVVDGVEGKQWLHHPAPRTRRAVLGYKLREHAEGLAYQAYIRAHRRQRLLETPPFTLGGAVPAGTQGVLRRQHQDQVRIKRLRKTEGPRYLEHLDEDSEEWAEVALCAEALEAHGFEGVPSACSPARSCLASCRSSWTPGSATPCRARSRW
ncbi:hypothetical protein ACPOLB_27130 [Rubrivivax sp. RP6-9]|uniref:hypothetical protein n=1 Tax=Rubrivivax sp. RP6-9 TaxID=3415750 RepID=UPI003CC5B640